MATGIKMLLVFALLGGTLWFLRRHDRSSLVSARRAERPVAVLAQAKVGKTSSVALVRIGTEAYAVGVTEQNVSLLVAQPIELPETTEADSAPVTSTDGGGAASARTTFPTVGEFLRSALGRQPKVEYLDVVLPSQMGPRDRTPSDLENPAGADGSGSSRSARMPEHVSRR